MNFPIRATIACLAVLSVTVAAVSKPGKRLTPQRLFELTSAKEVPPAKAYKVEVSGLGSVTLPAANPKGDIESIREFRFPTEFDPAQAAADGAPVIVPTTPTSFETVNTGWTIHLTAKPKGKLITVYGVADYVEAVLVPGGYGAIAGPIYDEKGGVITPNKLDQPKLQTTTTRFHIFALPGESYEVTFYRGSKAETHMVTVKPE